MIRQATIEDIPSIVSLIQAESGMWQDGWEDDVIYRAIKSSDGLAFVWDADKILGVICSHDVVFRGYISVGDTADFKMDRKPVAYSRYSKTQILHFRPTFCMLSKNSLFISLS